MKKTSVIFKLTILLITLTFLLTGCGQEPDKVKVGIYEAIEGSAYLEIQEDNVFILNRGAATDYDLSGNYTIYSNLLILHVEGPEGEDVINFHINGDILAFESGELAEDFIEKDAEFIYIGDDFNVESSNGLNNDSSNSLKTGVYLANEGFAVLRLEEDDKFTLHRKFGASNEPTGNFIIEGDMLILKVDEELEEHATKFKISGDSFTLQSGRLVEGVIKKDTEFLYRGEDITLDMLEEEYLKGNDNRFLEGIEFGIFDHGKDVAEKWGEPFFSGYLDGGLYMEYEDVVFHTDGHIDNKGYFIYGMINAIDSKESYGVKQGMTIEESREILGDPDARGIYDELKEYGHGIVGPSDFYYKGDFTMKVPYNHEENFVYRVHLGRFRDEPDILGSGFLELTDWELSKYEDYILDFDDKKLLDCTPMNIMKFYLHALKEKNFEAEWELYTKREDHSGWDKEYHMENLGDDNMYDFNIFSNVENIKVDYVNDYEYVVISWEDRDLEEYDSLGNPFRYNFSMVRDSDEDGNKIWKVGFKPMEY